MVILGPMLQAFTRRHRLSSLKQVKLLDCGIQMETAAGRMFISGFDRGFLQQTQCSLCIDGLSLQEATLTVSLGALKTATDSDDMSSVSFGSA